MLRASPLPFTLATIHLFFYRPASAMDPNSDVAALIAADQDLRRALQTSRKVDGLLMKREAEEMEALKQAVDELNKKYLRYWSLNMVSNATSSG
jgi:hypothetical protein